LFYYKNLGRLTTFKSLLVVSPPDFFSNLVSNDRADSIVKKTIRANALAPLPGIISTAEK